MSKKDKGLTPMMKQFFSFKEQHPDALLLFRCGDFYETYLQDAVDASRILGITLTRRSNGGQQDGTPTEMAGFPHHALDTYLPKLVRAGRRVAICDQLEDPKLTKKLVKRGITELVTPGVAMTDNVLDYKENNFLAAVNFGKAACGVAFLDISTGEFFAGEGSYDYVEKLLVNFSPKEVLYERGKRETFERWFGSKYFTFELDDWVFAEPTAEQKLLKHFGVKTLKGFGVDHLRSGIVASGAILQYLEMTQHTHIGHITSLSRIDEERYVRLDRFTIRSLELLHPMQDDGASLLDVLDRTVTPMGARLLKRWLVFPLRDAKAIEARLDVVDTFFRDTEFRGVVDSQFHRVGDLERIISKVAVGRVSPREVVQLRMALQALGPVKAACLESGDGALRRIGENISLCESLRDRIGREVNEDSPQLVSKGGVIKPGVNAELDELRSISTGGKEYLLKIQEREMEATGIIQQRLRLLPRSAQHVQGQGAGRLGAQADAGAGRAVHHAGAEGIRGENTRGGGQNPRAGDQALRRACSGNAGVHTGNTDGRRPDSQARLPAVVRQDGRGARIRPTRNRGRRHSARHQAGSPPRHRDTAAGR